MSRTLARSRSRSLLAFVAPSVTLAAALAPALALGGGDGVGVMAGLSPDWSAVVNARLLGDQLRWGTLGGDLVGTNLASGLDLALGTEGAFVWAGPDDDGLSLRVAGWGGRTSRIEPIEGPFLLGGCAASGLESADGACLRRAEVDHGGLVEGWENREDGLEQSFEVAELPEGDRLVVELDVEGADVEGTGETVVLRRPDGSRLLYGDLAVWDAAGRALPAVLAGEGSRLRIVVDTTDAVAPVTIDPLLTTASQSWSGSATYDRFGRVVRIADLDRDGYADVIVGAPSYSSGSGTGAVYVYDGGPSGPSTTPGTTLTSGVSDDRFGSSIAIVDLDVDGVSDLLIGAYQSDSTVSTSRSVYWFRGTTAGVQTSARGRLAATGNDFGYAVANVGDVYGDGYADYAVTAPHDSANTGAVYVYNGAGTMFPTAPTTSITGPVVGGESGLAVAGGDFNGDGYSDVAFSTTAASSGAGEVEIYNGQSGSMASAHTTLASPASGAAFGSALAVADVNGDGYDDLYVGAPSASTTATNAGAVYLYLGARGGLGASPSRTWNGPAASMRLGTALSSNGDVEGDGYADLVVGAPGASSSTGRVYVDRGSRSGPDGTMDQSIDGPSGAKQFGSALDLGGDVDADGYVDLVVGTYYSNTQTGQAWLYTGFRDEDADGSMADEDCDDTDASVHPGATETCDGVDEDCDGTVDDSPRDGTLYYADVDGDSYGDPRNTARACSLPHGYVTNFEDCDDTTVTIAPGAVEYCDGVDHDCDGDVNESTSVDAVVQYEDLDSDGYGDPDRSHTGCTVGPRQVLNGDDCDDDDGDVHPGADETCNSVDDDCDGTEDEDAVDASTWYTDRDADGFGDPASSARACEAPLGTVADATDCDDAASTVHPGADETCNDRDDDCDGTLDNDPVDPSTFYRDTDGDGYGDRGAPQAACDQPAGYVVDASDCDDAASTVHPSADETCNDRDDDCDGALDDSAIDQGTWYQDLDGDGFGDPAVTTIACDAPAGFVAVAGDCDDAQAAVSPAGTEVCNAVDDDCSGVADDHPTGAPAWYADVDGDGYGDDGHVYDGASCVQPEGYSGLLGDCDDASASVSPVATEHCDGVDEDCSGEADEEAVDAPAWYADVDGDGYGAGEAVWSCAAPVGSVADATDCNDGAASVFPGAAEVCDEVDQDCDGAVDEEPVDGITVYADLDGDTFGDAAAPMIACAVEAGTSSDATDCDDAAAGVYPGAVETCDGVDEDCDTVVDNDAVDMDTWYRDADADGFGDASLPLDACTQPDGFVGDATDCDDADAEVGTCPEATDDTAGDVGGTGLDPQAAVGCGCATGEAARSGGLFGWVGALLALATARRRAGRSA